MTYNELQAKAAELGYGKTVGVSTKDLEAFIASKEAGATPEAKQPSQEAVAAVKESQPKEDVPTYDQAVVLNGKSVVNTYSLAVHGERFLEIAQSLAKKKGFTVEMGFTKGKIECPNCGHSFN